MAELTDDENEPTVDGWRSFLRTRPWREIAFYALVGAWLVWLLAEASAWTRREDWLFPRSIGLIALGLVGVQIVILFASGFTERFVPDVVISDDESGLMPDIGGEGTVRPKRERDRFAVLMVLWIGGAIAAFYLFGFFETLPFAIFVFLYAFTRDLKLVAILTVAYTVFVFVLYAIVIKILPWQGRIWTELLPGLL